MLSYDTMSHFAGLCAIVLAGLNAYSHYWLAVAKAEGRSYPAFPVYFETLIVVILLGDYARFLEI
jgi:hypothetical protein